MALPAGRHPWGRRYSLWDTLPSPSPEGPGALGMAEGWKGPKPGPGLDLQGPLPCLCSQASPLLPSQERGKPSSEEIEPESIGLRDAICINR